MVKQTVVVVVTVHLVHNVQTVQMGVVVTSILAKVMFAVVELSPQNVLAVVVQIVKVRVVQKEPYVVVVTVALQKNSVWKALSVMVFLFVEITVVKKAEMDLVVVVIIVPVQKE